MNNRNKWSKTEIETLCKDLCHQIKEKNHSVLADSLHKLSSICGASECGCSGFTPNQKLSQLVKVQLTSGKLVDYSVGLCIISNFASLSHHYHCFAALENLLGRALKSDKSEIERDFLDRLWLCPGLREFKIELVSDFVCTESKYVEQDILSIFEKVTRESVDREAPIWEDLKFERIAYWSSKSAKVFCSVASILNKLLYQTLSSSEQFNVSEDVVSGFINCVKNHCIKNKTDFVLLYPSEYHSLITLMEVNPSMYLQSSSGVLLKVVELIKNSLVSNKAQTNCLLTHFPEWIEYIDT